MTIRVLFLCSRNRLRSPTAAAVFANAPGIEVDSAGLRDDADCPLSGEQIEWANLILVMETRHRTLLQRKFRPHLRGKRVGILNISDDYDFMEPSLIELLKVRCARYFLNFPIDWNVLPNS